MENLWVKESSSAGNVYVNLFASMPKEKWIGKEWENRHLYRSVKDNQHSTELRMKANMKFRMNEISEAMNLYNRSLCFAELKSENIALAYANRSACFFELKMYQETLIDIEMAKDAKIPERLLPKLDERKQQCAKLMAVMEVARQNPIKLSYEASQQYPCMANVLEIKENAEFGRHLVAKCDIPAGRVVLMETDFISVSSDDEIVCYTCFRSKVNFIACTQCPDVAFCSIDCSHQHKTHKWECGTFFADLHHQVQFQMQALLLAIEIFASVESLMEFVENILTEWPGKIPSSLDDAKSKYHFFLKLKTSTTWLEKHLAQAKEVYENVMMLPKINVLFDSDIKRCFLMHLVTHHFLVIKNNALVGGNPWSVVSVFNVLSMLNHSCAPNIYHPRHGSKQQCCVTIRPVKSGQQLFISYLSPNDRSTKEQRQLKLKSSWGFDCTCERCKPTNKQPIDCALIEADPCYRFVVDNYDNDNNNIEQLSVLLENCLQFMNKYGDSPWSTSINMVIDILMNLYIEMLL